MAVRLSGLMRRGHANAADLQVKRISLPFANLPPEFDGYRLLHLSDLHVGANPAIIGRWCEILAETPCDLVVITGDFQCLGHPHATETARLLAPLTRALSTVDGTVAILGNHDSADLPESLEQLGMRVLVNEALGIHRNGVAMRVVGTDDVHSFFTPAAPLALISHAGDFAIALVHTPDLIEVAEAAGYALYLCGHTHGGQIALPNGRPLWTALDRHHHLARGVWRHGQMVGHTSVGTGSGRPFVRFNTRPEATLIQLTRE